MLEAAPGAVTLVARDDKVEVATHGDAERDTIFRIASITKPVVAAAVLLLVDEGRLALDDRIDRWFPELASPVVVRTPESPVDDVVPAERALSVFDLLTFRAGWGFPSDFSLPAVQTLFAEAMASGRPAPFMSSNEWVTGLARVPLLAQPGTTWLYNTCSDLQGVLVERVTGQTLPVFLAERFFEPLGMVDTGFFVPETKHARLAASYTADLQRNDDPIWLSPPGFASGAGGLVSTADDWLRFGRMLLADGGGIVSPESVRLMTTNHLTDEQRDASTLFLEGQGWGFGGSVDVDRRDPWNVPGRYGWVGGSGTAAHVIPATGTVTILLTQVAMTGPTPPPLMRQFWLSAT